MSLLTTTDVGQDHVGGILVSTLYFGAGAAYGDPVYWETGIFDGDRDVHADLWGRCKTRDAAVAGHARAIAAVKTRQAAS